MGVRRVLHVDAAGPTVNLNRPAIVPVLDDLDTRRCPHLEKPEQLDPVEWWAIGESDEEFVMPFRGAMPEALSTAPCLLVCGYAIRSCPERLSQLAWRSAEGCPHRMIELAQALKTRRKRNLCDGQRRIVDERPRKVYAARQCHLNR
jgi:hypothetical protein